MMDSRIVARTVDDDYDLPWSSALAFSLPNELLCLVFFFAKFRDRLSCTQVCRRWRNVSLAEPRRLWNNVKSYRQQPGAFSGLLARSAGVPVSVRVFVRKCNAGEVGSAIAQHLNHITSLKVLVEERLGTIHILKLESRALTRVQSGLFIICPTFHILPAVESP